MPYLPDKELRKDLDEIVDLMKDKNIKADGDLNYILFKYCKYHIDKRYNSLKNYKAELRETADEIQREILGPYENMAKEVYGDV